MSAHHDRARYLVNREGFLRWRYDVRTDSGDEHRGHRPFKWWAMAAARRLAARHGR